MEGSVFFFYYYGFAVQEFFLYIRDLTNFWVSEDLKERI